MKGGMGMGEVGAHGLQGHIQPKLTVTWGAEGRAMGHSAE